MRYKMNKKIKKIIPRLMLILGGIILIFIILLGGVKANDYIKVNKIVKSADWLAKNGMHEEAYDSLTSAQSRWTTPKIKKEIENKIAAERQAMADKNYYIAGGLAYIKSMWQAAIDSYSQISPTAPFYKEAQDTIKECQTKIEQANAQAEKDKQAAQRSTAKAATTNDPFPTSPDTSKCDSLNTTEPSTSGFTLPNNEYISCVWEIKNAYRIAQIEWYIRHGQKIPDSLLPNNNTSSTQKNSTCKWNPYTGLYGGFDCSTR